MWYATRDGIFPNTSKLFDFLWDVRSVYALHGASSAIRWQAYEGALEAAYAGQLSGYDGQAFPHAEDIIALASRKFARGECMSAEQAAPIYVRNKVALKMSER